MTKILYIHGFGGSKDSKSVAELQKALGDGYEVLAETFDHNNPDQVMKDVCNFYVKHCADAPIVVGNSLGGFFAHELSKRWNAPVVLINPSLWPEKNLAKRGVAPEVLTWYDKLRRATGHNPPEMVIVGSEDEVVDPEKNGLSLHNAARVVFFGMGHELTMYDDAPKYIADFCNQIQGT